MYNRYIPQPDGTYRRSRIQDPPQQPKETRVQEPPCEPVPVQQKPPEPRKNPGKPCIPVRQPRGCNPTKSQPETTQGGVGAFLRQLLPRDFDTTDLIVVLLLLLISSDGCDESNNALLTLVLYLFL